MVAKELQNQTVTQNKKNKKKNENVTKPSTTNSRWRKWPREALRKEEKKRK